MLRKRGNGHPSVGICPNIDIMVISKFSISCNYSSFTTQNYYAYIATGNCMPAEPFDLRSFVCHPKVDVVVVDFCPLGTEINVLGRDWRCPRRGRLVLKRIARSRDHLPMFTKIHPVPFTFPCQQNGTFPVPVSRTKKCKVPSVAPF